MPDSRRIAGAALLLLPAGLMGYFAFNAGGFYAGATSYVAIVLCIVLVLRVLWRPEPFEGVGWPLAVAGGALGVYALWTLLSEQVVPRAGRRRGRVHPDARVPARRGRVRVDGADRAAAGLGGANLAFAITVVCLCGLITRMLPHLWPTSPTSSTSDSAIPCRTGTCSGCWPRSGSSSAST